jgi:putative redox protein
MNGTFTSGSLTLGSYLALPAIRTQAPAVIMCHGFPIGPLDARQSALTFPQLMDRLAAELGWAALTFTFRGCGTSEGDFSMQGWVDDLRAAIDHMERETNPSGIWLVGTNTGGSLALCVAADDRLRRLGSAAAPLPGARTRDRRHPPSVVPAILRRVEPRAAPLPSDRRRTQVRAAPVARDAR